MAGPGNDHVANIFKNVAAQLAANPGMELPALRATLEVFHTVCKEPTDVTYREEEKAGTCPGLWEIPVAAKNSPNVILYFHGGGYVTNTTSSHRKMVGHLAKAANCKALSLEYRLAPEAQFPAQLDDAVEAYRWLLKQGYKPSNIITAGDSAGGNLSMATALKLRELGEPLPAGIIGFSPWFDMYFSEGTIASNNDTDALVHGDTLGMMRTMFLGDHDLADPLANVSLADPKGLPPMYFAAGGFETLLDNSTKFAEKAKKAGVEVEVEISEGMQHVYPFMAGNDERADKTIANVGKWAQGKFGK